MESFRLSKLGWLAGAAVVLWATAGPAGAAPCVGTSVGAASADDVTLSGFEADKCVVSNVNAQEGPNGTSTGFESVFGGGWSVVTKIDERRRFFQNPSTVDGVSFDIGFKKNDDRISGSWRVTTNIDARFDLVFAMHASTQSGAFLFEDVLTTANATQSGRWRIEWLNDGGSVPDYSNLTLFVRDYRLEAPGSGAPPAEAAPAGTSPAGASPAGLQTVPEPATGLLILSGVVAVARARRRGQ